MISEVSKFFLFILYTFLIPCLITLYIVKTNIIYTCFKKNILHLPSSVIKKEIPFLIYQEKTMMMEFNIFIHFLIMQKPSIIINDIVYFSFKNTYIGISKNLFNKKVIQSIKNISIKKHFYELSSISIKQLYSIYNSENQDDNNTNNDATSIFSTRRYL